MDWKLLAMFKELDHLWLENGFVVGGNAGSPTVNNESSAIILAQ